MSTSVASPRSQPTPQRRDSNLSLQTPGKHPNHSASSLLAIPTPNFDPPLSLDFISESFTPIREKQSQIQKLAQENERLARELKELEERLAAAEQRSAELSQKSKVA